MRLHEPQNCVRTFCEAVWQPNRNRQWSRTAVKYSNGATARHVQYRPDEDRRAPTEPPNWRRRPVASRGSKRAWVTKWVTTGHDCRRRRWTFVDPWHAQTSPPPAQWLDLIRQRSDRRCVDSSPNSNPAAMSPAGDTRIGPSPAIDGPSWTLRESPPGSTDHKVGPRGTCLSASCPSRTDLACDSKVIMTAEAAARPQKLQRLRQVMHTLRRSHGDGKVFTTRPNGVFVPAIDDLGRSSQPHS